MNRLQVCIYTDPTVKIKPTEPNSTVPDESGREEILFTRAARQAILSGHYYGRAKYGTDYI